MSFKTVFKKVRPFLGLVIMLLLFCFCSIIVFFSVYSLLVLPLMWMIFTLLHQMFSKNKKITYLWNATRFSMWIYFITLFYFLIFTPQWMKTLSLYLERKSWFNIFQEGTFMYGRISTSFALAALVFAGFILHYRKSQNKQLSQSDED